MKKTKSMKRIITLPSEFQAVLISNEIQIEKGEINVDILRNLIYLYSVRI